MGKVGRNIFMGLAAMTMLAWGYVELNTYALNLGAHHHDALCQNHH
jgi:hypothetical protein